MSVTVSETSKREDSYSKGTFVGSEFLVAPSLLSADFSQLREEIQHVERAGADWIHVDVMDGHFVPNITLGPPVLRSLRPVTKIPLDVHLMIEQPERYVKDFMAAGADYLTIHVESTRQPQAVLEQIRSLGGKPGITLRPITPLADIDPFLSLVDLVLIMTVNPGFGGQSFMEDQVEKVEKVKEKLRKLNPHALVEVDGGINERTARACQAADVLVAGSYIFQSSEYSQAIKILKRSKTQKT